VIDFVAVPCLGAIPGVSIQSAEQGFYINPGFTTSNNSGRLRKIAGIFFFLFRLIILYFSLEKPNEVQLS
jgi:hypothetical protein